jgi:hypothetical protein
LRPARRRLLPDGRLSLDDTVERLLPGRFTFAAGLRDARRIVVVAVNGVGADAVQEMGHFLDVLLRRR